MRSMYNDPVVRLFVVISVLLLAVTLVTGFLALGIGQRALLPNLQRHVFTVGSEAQRKMEKAMDQFGVPFETLVGANDYLAEVVRSQPDISALAVTDAKGRLLYGGGRDSTQLSEIFGASKRSSASAGFDPVRWLNRASVAAVGGMPTRVAGRAHAVARNGYYDTSFPLRQQGAPVGELHVLVSQGFYRAEIIDQIRDIALISLVTVVAAFEVAVLLVTRGITGPLDMLHNNIEVACRGVLVRPARAVSGTTEVTRLVSAASLAIQRLGERLQDLLGQVQDLRRRFPERDHQKFLDEVAARPSALLQLPKETDSVVDQLSAFAGARICSFLFVLAEELARPFLPVFIKSYAEQSGLGSSDTLVGLPISMFLFVGAVSMPVMSEWCERIDRRLCFCIGALLSTAGMVGTAYAGDFWILVAWRCLAAVGYVMTFVACQAHVLDHADQDRRASGIAMFVSGITAADICGPAVGGLLAAQIGQQRTLLICAGVALFSAFVALIVLRKLSCGDANASAAPKRARLANLLAPLRNVRFTLLLIFAAVPAKLILSAVLFFLVPLAASDLGAGPAETGRLVMIYGLASFLFSPLFARWSDRWSLHGVAIGAGALIAGASMLPQLLSHSYPNVILAVAGLGLGQAMSISSQLAYALRVSEREIAEFGQPSVLGVYRLGERLGAAAGPILGGVLATAFDVGTAIGVLGAGAVIMSAAFSVAFLILEAGPHADDQIDEFDPLESAGANLAKAEA